MWKHVLNLNVDLAYITGTVKDRADPWPPSSSWLDNWSDSSATTKTTVMDTLNKRNSRLTSFWVHHIHKLNQIQASSLLKFKAHVWLGDRNNNNCKKKFDIVLNCHWLFTELASWIISGIGKVITNIIWDNEIDVWLTSRWLKVNAMNPLNLISIPNAILLNQSSCQRNNKALNKICVALKKWYHKFLHTAMKPLWEK